MNIEELKFLYQESIKNTKAHNEFIQQKDYFNGHQLSNEVLAILYERGQPPIYENIYHKIGNKIIGFKLAGRQDIKVIGRQRDDKNIAQILTDILKSITDTEEYLLQKHDNDIDLLLGMAVWQVGIRELSEEDSTGEKLKEVFLKHIPTESFYIDPLSQRRDAEDAKFFHKILYFDKDDFKKSFSKSNYVFNNTQREIIKVIESWVLDNFQWTRSFWCEKNNEILHQDINPYGFGHPFAIRKFNVEKNGNFYGLFRNIKPLQDAVNFSLIKLANKLGSIKMLVEIDAVDDITNFSAHFAKDDSITAVKSGAITQKKMEIINQNAEIMQIAQTINAYRQQADLLTGLNEEALGQAVNRLSGYAIEQRQNVGLIGVQQYVEASNSIDISAFKKVIFLIKKHYKAEQIFKIAEKENAYKEIKINEIQRDEYCQIIYDKDGNPKRTNTLMQVGYFDISLRTIPQTQGSMAERYNNNIQLMQVVAQTNPQLVPQILPLILKDSQSPISDEMRELIDNQSKSIELKNIQEMQQLQKEKEISELEINKAKIEELRAKTSKLTADNLKKINN